MMERPRSADSSSIPCAPLESQSTAVEPTEPGDAQKQSRLAAIRVTDEPTDLSTEDDPEYEPYSSNPGAQLDHAMASATQPHDLYADLQICGQEIRLLEIVSTTPTISCKLHIELITMCGIGCNKRTFHALSYVWGNPGDTEIIQVNGKDVPVTKNLANALRDVVRVWQSRFPSRSEVEHRLWADALCIDQSNVEEKNHQIPFMGTIYSEAEMVIGWLGIGNETLDCSMCIVEEMATVLELISQKKEPDNLDWLYKFDFLYEPNPSSEDPFMGFLRIRDLFDLPYWRRAWIFQEFCLARTCIFICGEESISVGMSIDRILSVADFIYDLKVRGLKERPSLVSTYEWDIVMYYYAPAFQELLRLRAHMRAFRQSQSTDYPSMRQMFRWMLSTAGRFLEATNPKDLFYGLIGISDIAIVPDYSENKTFAQVVLEYFATHLAIRKKFESDEEFAQFPMINNELYLLRFSGIGNGSVDTPGLPSWAPNFKRDTGGRRMLARTSVFDNALKAIFSGNTHNARIDGSELHVQAAIAEPILSVSPSLVTNPRDPGGATSWMLDFVLSRPEYINGWAPILAVFDTVYKQSVNKPRAPLLEEVIGLVSILEVCYKLRTAGLGNLSVAEYRQKAVDLIPDTLESETIQRFNLQGTRAIQYFRDLVDGKSLRGSFEPGVLKMKQHELEFKHGPLKPYRLAETQGGFLCLVPIGSAVGDIVSILKGAEQPSVLRASGDHYLHVGACFALGLEENVEDRVSTGALSIKEITLR